MKILLIAQLYYPENTRITDIVESLVKRDNEVTVLTGLPNYPNGYIFNEYKKRKNRKEVRNGVNIIRCKVFPRRHNLLARVINYYSFPLFASKLIKALDKDFDVVLAIQTSPIFMVKPAIKYAKKYHKPLVMYGMDLWPESLLAGGISPKSLVYKYYKGVSSRLYSKFDKILISTKEHIDYIKSLPKCANLDIEYLPQYAESIFEDSSYEHIDNGIIDLMFAGNIGKAQSVDTIIKAASLLKDDSRFKFHIVGNGSELNNVKKLAEKLETDNVVFYGQRPLIDMPKMFQLADAMLVSLEDKSYANMTIPGKVQSYMAMAKPIIGSINGSTAKLIFDEQIGYACKAEDEYALASLIKSLHSNELVKIGKHALDVYKNKFSKNSFMETLINELKKLAEQK